MYVDIVISTAFNLNKNVFFTFLFLFLFLSKSHIVSLGPNPTLSVFDQIPYCQSWTKPPIVKAVPETHQYARQFQFSLSVFFIKILYLLSSDAAGCCKKYNSWPLTERDSSKKMGQFEITRVNDITASLPRGSEPGLGELWEW